LPESNWQGLHLQQKEYFLRFRKVCGLFWTSFFNRSSRAGGIFLLSVSKSDESAKTNRNMFQEVTHCDKKIEQILNMFQKRTQQVKK